MSVKISVIDKMSVTPVIGSNFRKKLNFSNKNGSGQKFRRIFLNEIIYPGKSIYKLL